MNIHRVTKILGGLGVLKFFPADDQARTAILGIVCSMATDEDQVRWLVRRMTGLYNEWPGPREMRACFCSKFKPADNFIAYSDAFPNGIPSEKGEASTLLIGPPEVKRPKLIGDISADPELEKAIYNAAELKSMGRLPKRRISVGIPVNTDHKPITQADIDAAVARNRVQKAQAELLKGD